MQHFARVVDGAVVERIDLPDGLVPGVDVFTSELAADLVPCGADVTAGQVRIGDGFADPPKAATPVTAPVVIVTPRQFRRALLAADLLDDVEALMLEPETPRALKIDWEFATSICSDDPAWSDLIARIGKTQADLDALFEAAQSDAARA